MDRADWIPLSQLQPGERLLCSDASTSWDGESERGQTHAFVLGVTLSTVCEPVYNLEIHGEHVYQVGELGVLVHNAGADNYDLPRSVLSRLERNDDLLARNLGGRVENHTPHHLIGVAEAKKFDVMTRAAELGFDINRGSNGINLPNDPSLAKQLNLPYHPMRGRHRIDTYTGPIDERLRNLQQRYDDGLVTDGTLLDELRKLEDSIRVDLLRGELRLNSQYPWYQL